MPQKPNADVILDTYSQEEIVDLLKRKVMRDTEKFIESFKEQLAAVTRVFQTNLVSSTTQNLFQQGGSLFGTETSETDKPKRRGRPAKKETTNGKPSSEGESRQNLGDLILQTMGEEPMKIEQILGKVTELGWATKSNNPRALISQELARQVKKGSIAKAERARYKKVIA